MKTIALLFICLIPVILAFAIISFLHNSLQFESGLDVIEPSADGLRSGDIILIASLRLVPSFSWYKHVAIVYEDRMKQMRIADFTMDGLKSSTIHSFFSGYSPYVTFSLRRLKTPLTMEQNARLRKYVMEAENSVVNSNYVRSWIINRLFGSPALLSDDNCANFVARCTIESGIIKNPSWSYLTITDFTYRSGYFPMYGEEVMIDRTFFPSIKIFKK